MKMKENKSRKQPIISKELAKMKATITGIHSQENDNEDFAKNAYWLDVAR